MRLYDEQTAMKRYVESARVKELCISGEYTITMDLSMPITDDDHKLDRIYKSANLDEYKLRRVQTQTSTNSDEYELHKFANEQPGDSSY